MWSESSHASVLIVGFGKEGRAAAEFFQTHEPGFHLHVADQNPDFNVKQIQKDHPYIESVEAGESYLKHLARYDIIVKSPGIPWNESFEAVAKRVTSSTQLFFDHLDSSNRVIGVTGSKGKSTVSSLIAHVLKAHGEQVELVGNIGEVALKHIDAKDTTFVFELSSFQLERLDARVPIAVFTSFFPDHMDHHGNLENYFASKAHIVAKQETGDLFIAHGKYERLRNLKTAGRKILVEGVSELTGHHLLGKHNQENIKLVETLMSELGLDEAVTQKAIRSFKGLPHRIELVKEVKGVRYVNDAIATTPEATLAALDVYGEETGCLLLGGTDRGYDFSGLAKKVVELGIPNVVLFPDSGKAIYEALDRAADELGALMPNSFETKSMEEALHFASASCTKGDVVLLSTASPSYSLWKNFEAQGEDFRQAVNKIHHA